MTLEKIDVKNKTILVTGGTGFIGTALTKLLLDKGANVRTLDLSDKIDIIGYDNLKTYRGSIMDDDNVTLAVSGCDYVIHLAAMLGVGKTETERLKTLNTNIYGVKNMLDECVKAKVKKIVFSSSSEVYGEQTELPIAETNPLNPKSIYAVTKLVGEEYLKAYKQKYGLDYTIVRYHNAYGPRQNNNFVMSKFINQVLNWEQPTIYGKGNQIRCFCYVDDIANGTYLSLINEDANSEIFNIGNDKEPIGMKDLAKKIMKIYGRNLQFKYIDLDKSDRTVGREIFNRVPDINKAKKILGYKPKIKLEDGIKKTIKWWESMI
jgi:UDP-glucose 4-epimerase